MRIAVIDVTFDDMDYMSDEQEASDVEELHFSTSEGGRRLHVSPWSPPQKA